jgi:hypothetical protein
LISRQPTLAFLAEARAALSAIDQREVDSFVARDMSFRCEFKAFRLDFTAETFLISFSLPTSTSMQRPPMACCG